MAENNFHYKVLITAAGVSRQLGELVDYTNHALIRVGKKPTLSYIIEAYPESVPIIITVGHFGQQIKDFVSLAYPQRSIEFVTVDKYEGPGSSVGYSMLAAQKQLQCPFIYHAADTIVDDEIPVPDRNWIGGYQSQDTANYASLNVVGDKVIHIDDKGSTNYGYIHNIHIGLVGVNDYKLFWQTLGELYKKDPHNSKLGDMLVINEMLKNEQSVFYFQPVKKWYDVGNLEALQLARKNIHDPLYILDKVNESIFIFKDHVIKFFHDIDHVNHRVARAKILEGLVPNVSGVAGNFYRYDYIDGHLYSRIATPIDFLLFLDWAENKLWRKIENSAETTVADFKKICLDFYHKKSLERIAKLQKIAQLEDKEDTINQEKVPSIKDMFAMIDFDWLTDSEFSHYHGDFVLDNILKTTTGYRLLDWRQNFGGLLQAGDKYYDLAKLNHNLVVNHDIVNSNLYTIEIDSAGNITCDIMRKDNLVACQEVLHNFLRDNGYDIKKVKILTAIIWLNMSPLHNHPLNLFLYYYGKLNLWRQIKQTQAK